MLTTFVAQTSQSLSPDPIAVPASAILELVQLVRAIGNQTPVNDVASLSTAPVETMSNITAWVNGLWFVSLTLSLSTALFAVLAKQWVRQYMLNISGSPRERCYVHQFRYKALKKWHFQAIIGMLPIPLHVSLIIFLVGLVLFLIPLHIGIAAAVGTLSFILIGLYVATIILPLYYVECPFRTPSSDILYHTANRLSVFWETLHHCSWQKVKTPKTRGSTLRDQERVNALKDQSGGAPIVSCLQWLFSTTAHHSVKTIIHQSLGALPFEVSDRLSALQIKTIKESFFANQDWLLSQMNSVSTSAIITPAEADAASRLLCTYLVAHTDAHLGQITDLKIADRHQAVLLLAAGGRVSIEKSRVELPNLLNVELVRGDLERRAARRRTPELIRLPQWAWRLVIAASPRKEGIPTFLYGTPVVALLCQWFFEMVHASDALNSGNWTTVKAVSDGKDLSLKDYLMQNLNIVAELLNHGLEPWLHFDDSANVNPHLRLLLSLNQYILGNARRYMASKYGALHLVELWSNIGVYIKRNTRRNMNEDEAIFTSVHKLIDSISCTEPDMDPIPPRFVPAVDTALEVYQFLARYGYQSLAPSLPIIRMAARRDPFHIILRLAILLDVPQAYESFIEAAVDAALFPPTSTETHDEMSLFIRDFVTGVAKASTDQTAVAWPRETTSRCMGWVLDEQRLPLLVLTASSSRSNVRAFEKAVQCFRPRPNAKLLLILQKSIRNLRPRDPVNVPRHFLAWYTPTNLSARRKSANQVLLRLKHLALPMIL